MVLKFLHELNTLSFKLMLLLVMLFLTPLVSYAETSEITSAEKWFQLGMTQANNQQLDNAIISMTNAISEDNNYAKAYFFRSRLYFMKGSYELSIKDLSKIIEQNHSDPKLYYFRGLYTAKWAEKENRFYLYQRIIDDFSTVIKNDPNFADVYYDRALAYLAIGKYQLALDDNSKYISLKPNDVRAYYNRAICYSALQKDDLALADFSKAIEVQPTDGNAYYNRAMHFFGKKKFKIAINDFTSAIELNRRDVSSYYQRGIAYYELKEYSLALNDFEKASSLGHLKSRIGRAAILYERGMYKEAANECEYVLANLPVENVSEIMAVEELLRKINTKVPRSK